MNKGQLIESVAAELEISKASATRSVEAVVAAVIKGIKFDDHVTIVGFGSFGKKRRAPRTVRNPSTGENMNIGESMTVGFKPSQSLKDELAKLAFQEVAN